MADILDWNSVYFFLVTWGVSEEAAQVLGWAGYIRVDTTTYTFLGAPGVTAPLAVQKSAKAREWLMAVFSLDAYYWQFTSTQSVFVLKAGGVDLTATFLSPVEVRNF